MAARFYFSEYCEWRGATRHISPDPVTGAFRRERLIDALKHSKLGGLDWDPRYNTRELKDKPTKKRRRNLMWFLLDHRVAHAVLEKLRDAHFMDGEYGPDYTVVTVYFPDEDHLDRFQPPRYETRIKQKRARHAR